MAEEELAKITPPSQRKTPPGLIAEAGIRSGFPEDAYHADPCPAPSLTQSIAKILNDQSPLHAWYAHPRLNPNWQRKEEKKYDLGNVAHALLLGRGKQLVIIKGDDWVSDRKEKTRLREEAANEGKIGVLSLTYDTAVAMVEAAFAQLKARGYGNDFGPQIPAEVTAEIVAVGQGIDGIWMRALIDWLPRLTRPWDYKTTARSAAPHALEWAAEDAGWDIQAAMHERLLNIIDPDNAGRREHKFIVQECYEPYALTVVRLTEGSLTIGRKKLARAEAIFARCLGSGQWPAYPLETMNVDPTARGEARWLQREISEDENRGRGQVLDSMMAG